jgi:hypothetical protein
MWLGLLFSILNIVMLSFRQFNNEPPEYEGIAESLFELYRIRTAQCLIVGDITKCLPHTLETLIHYAIAEHSRKIDNARGLWLMAGMIVRAAVVSLTLELQVFIIPRSSHSLYCVVTIPVEIKGL